MLAAGSVVTEMGRSFDRYWSSEAAIPIASATGLPQAALELQKLWNDMAARALRFRDSDYVRDLRKTAFGGLARSGRVPIKAVDQMPRPIQSL